MKNFKCLADHKDCWYRGWMDESEMQLHLEEYPDHAQRIYNARADLASQFSLSPNDFNEMEKSLAEDLKAAGIESSAHNFQSLDPI